MTPYVPAVEFRGTVERVIDGDTVQVLLDLGFDALARVQLRLADVDAPELRGAESTQGRVARQLVRDRLPVGTPIVVISTQRRSFARYVGTLLAYDALGELYDVAGTLVFLHPELFQRMAA